MEDKIKELLGVYLKDDACKKEDRDKLLNETWLWLVKEYDKSNVSHIALITAVKNAIIETV